MAENRNPPAYQEYAATMLANKSFRLMTMHQRGLLFAMRLECWANLEIPNNSKELSAYLGQTVTEDSLQAVLPFFEVEGTRLFSPELDAYRNHLEERREKQSRGGKNGAKITNAKKKRTDKSQATRRGSDGSLVQISKEQNSQTQLIGESVTNYLNIDLVDPLDAELSTAPLSCKRCSGDGCDWCNHK